MTSIVFTPTGQGRCLYTEAIDLNCLGKLHIRRATRIEFDNRLGAWRVRDMGGFPLFTASTRQQCLEWEMKYFESKEDQRHGGTIKGTGEPPLCLPVSAGVRRAERAGAHEAERGGKVDKQKGTTMTINELIVRAAVAYPEAAVLDCWDMARERPLKRDSGDTLALFVARELKDTFDFQADEATQIATAVSAMQTAADELQRVAHHLSDLAVQRAA